MQAQTAPDSNAVPESTFTGLFEAQETYDLGNQNLRKGPALAPAADTDLRGLVIKDSVLTANTFGIGFYKIPVTAGEAYTLTGRTNRTILKAGYISGTRYIGTQLTETATAKTVRTFAYDIANPGTNNLLSSTSAYTSLDRAMLQSCIDPSTRTPCRKRLNCMFPHRKELRQ